MSLTNKVSTILLTVLLLVVYAIALELEIDLQEISGVSLFECAEGGLSVAEAWNVIEQAEEDSLSSSQKGMALAFCKSDGLHVVESAGIGRQAEVNLVYSCGDAAALFGDVAHGASLKAGECAISSAASIDLFGSAKTLGLRIMCENVEYQITYVSENETPLLIVSPYIRNLASANFDALEPTLITTQESPAEDIALVDLPSGDETNDFVLDFAILRGSDVRAEQVFASVPQMRESTIQGLDIYAAIMLCVLVPVILMVVALCGYGLLRLARNRSCLLGSLICGAVTTVLVSAWLFLWWGGRLDPSSAINRIWTILCDRNTSLSVFIGNCLTAVLSGDASIYASSKTQAIDCMALSGCAALAVVLLVAQQVALNEYLKVKKMGSREYAVLFAKSLVVSALSGSAILVLLCANGLNVRDCLALIAMPLVLQCGIWVWGLVPEKCWRERSR